MAFVGVVVKPVGKPDALVGHVRLMAYAATHEIGHLLLGPNHTSSGIMRAVWGKTEYRDMAQRWLGFSAAEQQALPRAIPTPDQRMASLK
jgi:hypothetical protein